MLLQEDGKVSDVGNVSDVLFYKMEEDNPFIIKGNLKNKTRKSRWA
jgi:hypothetical protein